MRIWEVQVLRIISASIVVFGHCLGFAETYAKRFHYHIPILNPVGLGIGVDVFFVVSGFIMTVSCFSKGAKKQDFFNFIYKRVLRICPLYWLVLVFELIRLYLMKKHLPSLNKVLCAFFFIPSENISTGLMRPFYEIGWTLNYEMFFYLAFALFISQRFIICYVCTAAFFSFLLFLALFLAFLGGFSGVILSLYI